MDEENTSDFDFTLDNFYAFFSSESIPAVSIAAVPLAKYKEIAVRRRTLQTLPKVMKNDIRRYYPQMFMNTVNSGDFDQLQSFFSTFMMRHAKFTVHHDNFNPTYHIPPIFAAEGPALMSHFHLGMYVMCPDMIMRVRSTRIVTSNTWTGTRIEMSVDISCNKVSDLSAEEWVPQLEYLEE
eukprot:gene21593-24488_t